MPKMPFVRASLAALAMAALPVSAVQAQDVIGSGLAPNEMPNTAAREVRFASAVPEAAALAIFADSAELAAGLPLTQVERAALQAAIASGGFSGKADETLLLRGIGTRPALLLVGTGEDESENAPARAGGHVAQKLGGEKAPLAVVGLSSAQAAAAAALGFNLGEYRFDRYLTGATETPPSDAVTFVLAAANGARAAYENRQAGIAEGVRFTRDLVNEPANVVYPESFVERTRAAFRGIPGVEIEVLDEAAMRKLGMGAIVGVGQGSPRGSRLLLVTYRGSREAPLALVGKGITFDSGGISLKPSSGMGDMKADMSGAAAVVGAALALARSQAPVHVVAVAALAENMPGGNAQRPGDVVRTMGGKTIEIVNTDAEGRLVLADAVQYVAKEREPFALVDIATLTGAAVSALGPEYAGLFARDDAVAERLAAAAEQTGEAVWRLPLNPRYADAVKSDIADVKNSGTSPAPGASAGAHFIGAFIDEEMPWAHIDMAPTMFFDSAGPLGPKGASGYGVRLLEALARDWQPAR